VGLMLGGDMGSAPKRSLINPSGTLKPVFWKGSAATALRRGHGRFDVSKKAKVLIELRAFENHPDAFLRSSEEENAAFKFQALHGADQDGNARAVDVRDLREIDNEAFRFLAVDDRTKRGAKFRRNMQIDGPTGSEQA
jgi:hypothetical protein